MANLATWAAQIGADPGDSDDVRVQKTILVFCALPFVLAGFAWGLMYYLFGEPLAAAIPAGYGLFSIFSIVLLGLTRSYRLFRFAQLTLILLLPTMLMWTLGGFVTGSAVILWALICPMGAVIFDRRRNALIWFAAFLALIVLSGLLQPYLPVTSSLSAGIIVFFFVINFVGVTSIIFLMTYYFVGEKNAFQARSEALLLNILPKEIADILKREQRVIADQFDGASVLFADIVDFTPMAAKMTPDEVVQLLNEVFSQFDALADKHDLEKIKTIGDCYMLAAGVPRPRPDHAHVLTRMALEMRDYVAGNEIRGRRLGFRIGLNSGPVVAGVIGRKKFIYDLWGDAVNTASRMESHGRAGVIQITRGTYDLIKDDFTCEPGGVIDVKGVGPMETWFVTGQKMPATAD